MLRYAQYTLLFVLSGIRICVAQVGINTETPDPSAALDIRDKERGLLIPRMENADRQNIQNTNTAANALLVFDTQDKKFYFFDKAAGVWSAVNMWISNDDVTKTNEPVYYNGPGNVGIGTANPQAKLHVGGTSSMIIPAGTNNQRPPAAARPGEIRFNTSSQSLETNIGGNWSSIVPAGTILPFAGATVPEGWLLCDGRPVGRTAFPNLFSAVGTAWGNGNGSSTFNIPDLRGMFLRGVDGNSNNDPDKGTRVANAAGGNTGNAVGSKQGDSFRSHNHDITDPGHSHQFRDQYNPPRRSDNAADRWVADDQPIDSEKSTESSTTGITINANGGSETRPKNAYVNYIIKF